MLIVKVTYTTTPAYAEQNQANIHTVMNDLKALNNPGINYHVCLAPDGKTFTHLAFFTGDAERKILTQLPSFIHFQQQLKASGPEVPPQQEMPTLVGSSKPIF